MIESIQITSVATYDSTPQVLDGLSKFNFLFGSNGSGKTTVSRIIADEDKFPTCKVIWKGGMNLHPLVYNRDFVEHNFNQIYELKGVFTLGEKQVDTLSKIASAKDELSKLEIEIKSLTCTLQGIDGKSGKLGELATCEEAFKKKCWAQKKKHDATLKDAFKGYRDDSKKFKDKILQESKCNTAQLVALTDLEKKAESIFRQTSLIEQAIPSVEIEKLIKHEDNPVLRKRVIGKEDVDIAAMIKKLGNSDWIRTGRTFYDINARKCPFCQQSTTEAFTQSLNEYFDETFINDTKEIDSLAANYAAAAADLKKQLISIIAVPSKFLDIEKLKIEKELLDSKVTINNQRLSEKKKEASQIVELESHSDVAVKIKSLIDHTNNLVTEHNDRIANLSRERDTLIEQTWRYVLNELKTDLDTYNTEYDNLNKAITAIKKKIEDTEKNRKSRVNKIKELEKQITSVQPTIDRINTLLLSFGFNGFKLAKAANGTSYRLIRSDGSDAKDTLSEGEKSFVTFLYFYHLLKGSESDNGIITDRIVVFDDPVSSLDSNILFIVSSLIKRLFDEVRTGTSNIKQVFVLTHNIYFHKEITFNKNRRDIAMNEETFWVVQKSEMFSKFVKHDKNPIKTSYELLWAEIRESNRSNLTIQNTLRRILENYFKLLGGVDPDEICAKFDGVEKIICNSLFSWVNDGSHSVHDDLYVSVDNSMIETYLKVFRQIFDKSNHLAHYKMMMGDAF